MSVAEQWKAVGSDLPDGWAKATLRLELADEEAADRAAANLGPAGPYRSAPTVLLVTVARDGSAASPDALERLLRRVPAAALQRSASWRPQSCP